MKTKRISVISTVIVTLLFASLSFAQPPAKPFSPNRPGMQNMCLQNAAIFNKLNLTDAQKDNFQKLRLTFQKQMIDLKANLQKSKLDLKEIQAQDNIDRSDVIDVVKKINSNKNAIALASANHRMDMYDILTPAQRLIWKDFKMHRMAGKKMMKMKKMMKKRMR